MTKKELITHLNTLAEYVDTAETDVKSLRETLDSIRSLLEELPGDASEIEEDE